MATKVREIIRELEANGWQQVRQRGSHRSFQKPGNPNTVVVAGKPSDDLPIGTVLSIRRRAGLP
jgi:predicted RNA binding protein YcfA (HicA-like mRNA interferase family)